MNTLEGKNRNKFNFAVFWGVLSWVVGAVENR